MELNLQIIDFTNDSKEIKQKYICYLQLGSNIMPEIKWNKNNDAKSYALIMEDPYAVNGNFIHLYIPYINNTITQIGSLNINSINHFYNNIEKLIKNNDLGEIKILFGKNSTGEFGYHGPCAPKDTGIHHYIFKLYALNNSVKQLSITGTKQFENLFKTYIIDSFSVQFPHSYKYYSKKNDT